jgi:hypothetical protein
MIKNIYIALTSFIFVSLTAVPILASEQKICNPDIDISTIKDMVIDDNAKYISNEAQITVNRPVSEVFKWVIYAPLEKQLTGTKDLPGVYTTRALNNIKLGDPGYKRLVCLNDGNTAAEEVISNITDKYYSYKVWNYSLKIGQNIKYAKGEWWFTPAGDKTHIKWRYSFTLNDEKFIGKTGCLGRWLFGKLFVNTKWDVYMKATLKKIKIDTESKDFKIKNIESK